MRIATTVTGLRNHLAEARSNGKSIGFVPTMGALHEGHLSLVDRSRAENDLTVASIFVNPTQFGPHEDIDRYPRPLSKDCLTLAERGCQVVFAPATREVYPDNDFLAVDVGPVAEPMEGSFRPTHFRGVATVVLKLFQIVCPDLAYFGRKDYQQTLVIQELVRCLHLPIGLVVCPTVREPDGLALSSRNAYLGASDRKRAAGIWKSLQLAEELVLSGTTEVAELETAIANQLSDSGIDQIDYIAIVKEGTVTPISKVDGPVVVAVAVRVGNARLIDNHTITVISQSGQELDHNRPHSITANED